MQGIFFNCIEDSSGVLNEPLQCEEVAKVCPRLKRAISGVLIDYEHLSQMIKKRINLQHALINKINAIGKTVFSERPVMNERSSCIKDVRVHAPITRIQLGIPIYFIDHSEFITVQCEKILSRENNNEIKCFEFKTSLENSYSWINFNISICFPPLWENMTILSK